MYKTNTTLDLQFRKLAQLIHIPKLDDGIATLT